MKLLLAALLLLTGCKTYQNLTNETFPPTDDYVQQFYQDCEQRQKFCHWYGTFKIKVVRDLSVGWDRFDAGYCEFLTSTIYIDYASWKYSTDTQKRILLYHELGHCALRKVFHYDGQVSGLDMTNPIRHMIPKSIMAGKGNLPTEDQFLSNQEYYLNELFN